MSSHINISVDFKIIGRPVADVRVQSHQTVKQLITDLCKNFGYDQLIRELQVYSIRVQNKNMVLRDHDYLSEYKVSSGSIIEIL